MYALNEVTGTSVSSLSCKNDEKAAIKRAQKLKVNWRFLTKNRRNIKKLGVVSVHLNSHFLQKV